jgi:hypothetical protein
MTDLSERAEAVRQAREAELLAALSGKPRGTPVDRTAELMRIIGEERIETVAVRNAPRWLRFQTRPRKPSAVPLDRLQRLNKTGPPPLPPATLLLPNFLRQAGTQNEKTTRFCPDFRK